jgi:hypothetical protein
MRILFILLLASIGAKAQDTRIDWRYHNSGFAGEFYTKNLGKVADTSTYKIIGINPTTGKHVYMNWLYAGSGGGGSTSPAGNFGNVQLARNGAFSAAGSDSLSFLAGLAIKGSLSATTDMQISGISGFGMAPSSGVRAYFQGSGTSSSTYSAAFRNSSSQNVMLIRDDHLTQLQGNIDIDASTYNPGSRVINAKSNSNAFNTYHTSFVNSDAATIFSVANNGDANVLNRLFIGSGAGTPTARLHLPAGTATASTGPLKFTRGTVMTTGEDGSMEFGNNARLFLTRGTSRKAVPLADTTTVVDGSMLVGDGTTGEFRVATITYDGTSTLAATAGALSITLTGQLIAQSVSDADATIGGYQRQVRLAGNLTANRVLTFPTPVVTQIYTIEVWNRNTAGFTWTISGTVVDAAGNPITTLVNSTYYIFKTTGLGAAWVKVN